MLFFPLLIIMFCLDAIIYKKNCLCSLSDTPLFVSYHIEVVHNGKKNFVRISTSMLPPRDALALIKLFIQNSCSTYDD